MFSFLGSIWGMFYVKYIWKRTVVYIINNQKEFSVAQVATYNVLKYLI